VNPITDLLQRGPVIVNVGVRDFAEAIAEQKAPVVQVDWAPPPQLEADLAELLEELT
jgi:hypothetical protein